MEPPFQTPSLLGTFPGVPHQGHIQCRRSSLSCLNGWTFLSLNQHRAHLGGQRGPRRVPIEEVSVPRPTRRFLPRGVPNTLMPCNARGISPPLQTDGASRSSTCAALSHSFTLGNVMGDSVITLPQENGRGAVELPEERNNVWCSPAQTLQYGAPGHEVECSNSIHRHHCCRGAPSTTSPTCRAIGPRHQSTNHIARHNASDPSIGLRERG